MISYVCIYLFTERRYRLMLSLIKIMPKPFYLFYNQRSVRPNSESCNDVTGDEILPSTIIRIPNSEKSRSFRIKVLFYYLLMHFQYTCPIRIYFI